MSSAGIFTQAKARQHPSNQTLQHKRTNTAHPQNLDIQTHHPRPENGRAGHFRAILNRVSSLKKKKRKKELEEMEKKKTVNSHRRAMR